jgi:hypothetical protein
VAVTSVQVDLPLGPLAGSAFPANAVVNGTVTIVNGVGSAATVDHLEIATYNDALSVPLPGTGVTISLPVFGPNSPYATVASGATLVIPFSVVGHAPQATTLGSAHNGVANSTYNIQSTLYTTDGQVLQDGQTGQYTLVITPITWNTGG